MPGVRCRRQRQSLVVFRLVAGHWTFTGGSESGVQNVLEIS